jgi:hypothetical protein
MAIQLPAGFAGYSPAEKIDYFNQANITPAQLMGEGVPQSDINYMLQNGYNAGGLPIGASVGFDLPQNWQSFAPEQKIEYFNEANITPTDLLNVGVPAEDISWMQNNGYTAGMPAAIIPGPETTLPVTTGTGTTTLPVNTGNVTTTGTTIPLVTTPFTLTPAQIANTPGMGLTGIGVNAPAVPAAVNTAAPVTSASGFTLPEGWTGYTPAQKISWFNSNNVVPSQLTAAGVPASDINWMTQNGYTAGRPFANAMQGFDQNFRNYTSIPIGAQYNPNVTAFGESPYSQIQTQTQPFANPYANFQSGQAMGGYDPNLYNTDLLTSFVRDRAATAAEGAAPVEDIPNAGPGDGGSSYAQGGLIDRVSGPNPPGPDDGSGMLDLGEYVVKKSSVKKYGKGLLDMINDGKISAKKMKSLLG